MGGFKGLKVARRVIEDCMKNVHPIYHIKVGWGGVGWGGVGWGGVGWGGVGWGGAGWGGGGG
jgi:hypothetical protein